MLLSIGMIVKNEEKHLRDCLTALSPILESLESELIIYDTGSTDNTIDIAREFTENVFQIEWKGDFAWARNHTLNKSQGKWYMVVDADEVFENTESIIEFFISGEHKHFASATVKLENVGEVESATFSPTRLHKMYKGITWRGKIHETIIATAPQKHLKSKIMHYGYKHETVEQLRTKTERNLIPLIDELKSSPNDARLYWHIANEYRNLSDTYEALRQNELGLSHVEPHSLYFDALCFQRAKLFQLQNKPEDVIEAIRYYFDKAVSKQQIAIEIKLLEADTYYGLKRYDEAIEAYKQAHQLYWQNKADKLSERYGTIFPLRTRLLEDESISLKGILNVYVAMGDFDTAWEWINLHKETFSNVKKGHLYFRYVLKAAAEKDYDGIVLLHDYACENFLHGSDDYIEVVSPIEILLSKDAKAAVAEAVVEAADAKSPPATDDYSMLARLRVMFKNQDDRLKETLSHFLMQEGTINQMYGEVIMYAIQSDSDFSMFLRNLRITNTDELCKAFGAVENAAHILLDYIESNLSHEVGTKRIRLFGSAANSLLSSAVTERRSEDEEKLELQNETKIRLFEAAARLNYRQLKHVYKPEAFCENSSALHERDEFFFYAGTAYEKMDAGDHLGFVRNMRHVVKISDQVRDTAKLILERLQEEHPPSEPESKKSLQDQLKDEISNLKDVIYASIKAGDREKASMLITSYAAINPKDPDIPTIKQMIENWIKEDK